MYINESLGLYPRFDGDIQLIQPGWTSDMPLPEGWEVVIADEPPVVESNQEWFEVAPKKIDGVWHRQFDVRELTEEELGRRRSLSNPKNLTPPDSGAWVWDSNNKIWVESSDF